MLHPASQRTLPRQLAPPHQRARRPIPRHEIDFLAAWIIPEDTWYIIPLAAIGSVTSLLFRRKRDPKPGLYDAYREAWHLLRP
jgi:hypothetical protein